MFNEDHYIVDMLEAGALGYLLKNADKEEIIEAVETVYKGYPFYCSSTSSKLTRIISKSKFDPYKIKTLPKLNEREIKIIQLICMEKTTKEIGQELFMSPRTVEGYRIRILEKINAKSTAGIVIFSVKTGIYKGLP
jgi:DNA-binding NarL/FixJ family response regulator